MAGSSSEIDEVRFSLPNKHHFLQDLSAFGLDNLPLGIFSTTGTEPRTEVRPAADVEPALKDAFARKNELVFLDFITDQTENVYPMIPGGKGITEMILSEEL